MSHFIAFSSKKSERIVSSVYAAEALAIARAFDAARALQYDIQSILNLHFDIELRLDSLAVFKTITQNTAPRERRLAIDLLILRERWIKLTQIAPKKR